MYKMPNFLGTQGDVGKPNFLTYKGDVGLFFFYLFTAPNFLVTQGDVGSRLRLRCQSMSNFHSMGDVDMLYKLGCSLGRAPR